MPATIAQVRKMALALPETAEVITWESELTWRVNNKIFVMGGPDSPGVSLKCTKHDQAELVAMDPETYKVAAYVGRFGWVQVTLARVAAPELRELITESWRQIAPKRLVKAFDSGA